MHLGKNIIELPTMFMEICPRILISRTSLRIRHVVKRRRSARMTPMRGMLLVLLVCLPNVAFAWNWVPTDEEIQKYRLSWNPFSHGPLLQQSVDIMPQGQWSIRPFIFSQIGEHSFGNKFALAT